MKELFFSLEGRISRSQFWIGLLILFVVQAVLYFILSLLGLVSLEPEAGMNVTQGIVQLAITILFVWMGVCLYGKRYHDRDKSAWWCLIVLIPIIGAIWQLIECGLLKGTEGTNRFGSDPLG